MFEGGHDPEIAAAAANRPEQIRMLARIRRDEAPAREEYLSCQHVVARCTKTRHQHVLAPTERQSAEANLRAPAGWRHEPIRPPGGHQLRDERAALDAHGQQGRVNDDAI